MELIFKYPKLISISAKINLAKNTNPNALLFLPKNLDNDILSDLYANPNAIHLFEKKYDVSKINWKKLSLNNHPKALDILIANQDKIDWYNLSKNTNPKALGLLANNPKKINWKNLSGNETTEAIHILLNNFKRINWTFLSSNKHPMAIQILNDNQDKIDWHSITLNHNPAILPILERCDDTDLIPWNLLSTNPIAIPFLEKHPDKINWSYLTLNTNGIELLLNNIDKVDPYNIHHHIIYQKYISSFGGIEEDTEDEDDEIIIQRPDIFDRFLLNIIEEPDGLDILESNFDKIKDFEYVHRRLDNNPVLFDLDYQKMSILRSKIIYTELISKALHPTRISKWLDYHLEQGYDITSFEI